MAYRRNTTKRLLYTEYFLMNLYTGATFSTGPPALGVYPGIPRALAPLFYRNGTMYPSPLKLPLAVSPPMV